jgi:hypothetical protein
MPKTSRDTKKDCGKPGCPNVYRSQVLARGDEDRMSATSANGRYCCKSRKSNDAENLAKANV